MFKLYKILVYKVYEIDGDLSVITVYRVLSSACDSQEILLVILHVCLEYRDLLRGRGCRQSTEAKRTILMPPKSLPECRFYSQYLPSCMANAAAHREPGLLAIRCTALLAISQFLLSQRWRAPARQYYQSLNLLFAH